jgi:hypothetical protein
LGQRVASGAWQHEQRPPDALSAGEDHAEVGQLGDDRVAVVKGPLRGAKPPLEPTAAHGPATTEDDQLRRVAIDETSLGGSNELAPTHLSSAGTGHDDVALFVHSEEVERGLEDRWVVEGYASPGCFR